MGTLYYPGTNSYIIDYSWDQTWLNNPQLFVEKKVAAVMRYFSFDATKNLGGIGPVGSEKWRNSEISVLESLGIPWLGHWEANQTGPLGGRDAGKRHGAEFYRQGKIAGLPDAGPWVLASDFDVQPPQYSTVKDYYEGAASVLPDEAIIGTYGHDRIVTYLHDDGVCQLFWQCAAWSGGRRSPYAMVFQHARPPVIPNTDDNTALTGTFPFLIPGEPIPPDPQQGVTMGSYIGAVDVSDGRSGVLIFGSDGLYYKYDFHPGGVFYAFPHGKIGAAEYDSLPVWNAKADAYWLTDRYKERLPNIDAISPGGGATPEQIADELSRRLARDA